MPKLKTNRGAKKRFSVASSGKVKRGQSKRRHILTSKSPKSKRHLRASAYVHAANIKAVRALLPNS